MDTDDKANNDFILINNIKNDVNVDYSLKLLEELYGGIYYKIIHYYFSHDSNKHQKDEILQDCCYYIYQSAKDFDFSKKTKFSSYLGNRARWACLNQINKNKKNCLDVPANTDISTKESMECINRSNGNNFYSELRDKEVFELFFSDLKSNEQVYKIFKLRYLEGTNNKLMPWRQVGKEMNLSIQGCINIHDRFLQKIKKQKKYDK